MSADLSRFWGRKVKSVRLKIGQAKNRIKKTDGTNIIATNFIREQLKTLYDWLESRKLQLIAEKSSTTVHSLEQGGQVWPTPHYQQYSNTSKVKSTGC